MSDLEVCTLQANMDGANGMPSLGVNSALGTNEWKVFVLSVFHNFVYKTLIE